MAKIPRIPAPIVDRIPPPIVTSPSFNPPVVEALAKPIIDIPSYEPPSFETPTFVPGPSIPGVGDFGQQGPNPNEGEGSEDPGRVLPSPTAGRPVVEVPIVGEVPLPTSSEVALAGTTAVGATAAALLGKSLVDWLVKRLRPVVKKVMLKIKEAQGKLFTDYEVQQFFEFEGRLPVAKLLKAEQKAEKKRQLEAHLQRQHQRKR